MKTLAAAFCIGWMVVSCAPSTPQARIQKNPSAFEALTKKEQDLVREGKISRGMSKEAVKLAWGNPAQSFEGSRNGRTAERWEYTSTKAVQTQSVYSGYGPYNSLGYSPYSGYGFGWGPEYAYLSYRSASVWFVGDRVDSWERLK